MTGVWQLCWGPILAASGKPGLRGCSDLVPGWVPPAGTGRRTAAPVHAACAGTARPGHVPLLTALQSTGTHAEASQPPPSRTGAIA